MLKVALHVIQIYANIACTDKNECFQVHINELNTRN